MEISGGMLLLTAEALRLLMVVERLYEDNHLRLQSLHDRSIAKYNKEIRCYPHTPLDEEERAN